MTYAPGPFRRTSATPFGRWLWVFLVDRTDQLAATSDQGRPAAEGIAEDLETAATANGFSLSEFGHRGHQMLGHMIRQVLAAAGYEIERKRTVTRPGCRFKTAAKYRRADVVAN